MNDEIYDMHQAMQDGLSKEVIEITKRGVKVNDNIVCAVLHHLILVSDTLGIKGNHVCSITKSATDEGIKSMKKGGR